jgi:hypothetical protein
VLSPFLLKQFLSQEPSIGVRGELQQELTLSPADLKAMPPFLIQDVPIIPERVRDRKDEEKVIQKSFRGVLLRDVLWKAGLKYKRKWEPGTFIQVRNRDNREIVFSFGEIFYSSIGRSVLIAYEQWNQPCAPTLVVATDIHDGRMMTDLTEIKVSRVDVELLAYQDQEKKIVRPPSTEFTFVDPIAKVQRVVKPADLKALPKIHIPAAANSGLYGSIGRKLRFPTMRNLYSDGVVGPVGNPDLEEESTINLEAGTNITVNPKMQISGAYFYSHVKNMINFDNLIGRFEQYPNRD